MRHQADRMMRMMMNACGFVFIEFTLMTMTSNAFFASYGNGLPSRGKEKRKQMQLMNILGLFEKMRQVD